MIIGRFYLVLALLQGAVFADVITIGEASLDLPAPAGFHQLQAGGIVWETYQAMIASSSNRLLGYYASEEDWASVQAGDLPKLTRLFHAQTPKGMEAGAISLQQFGEMAHGLSAFMGKKKDDDDSLPELEVGATQSLGVYAQGADHVRFASLSRIALEIEGKSTERVTYTASSMTNVAGKLMNFYCTVDGESPEERRWAREQLAQWSQAVLASNPAPPKEETPVNPLIIVAGIGLGCLSALLLVFLWSKRRKH